MPEIKPMLTEDDALKEYNSGSDWAFEPDTVAKRIATSIDYLADPSIMPKRFDVFHIYSGYFCNY